MKDFKYLLDIFIGTFTSVFSFLYGWLSDAFHSGLSPSIPAMIAGFLLIFIWFGSAFFAASVAESKARARLPHFILGLLIPWLYPVAILFVLPKWKEPVPEAEMPLDEEMFEESEVAHKPSPNATIPKIGMKKEAPRADETMRMTRVAPAPKHPRYATMTDTLTSKMSRESIAAATNNVQQPSAEPQDEVPQVIDQRYFASISVDDNGNHQGPFMIEMSDGRILEALRIMNSLPDVALLEIPGEKGVPKTIRVPYSKMFNVKLKSQWID